MHLGCLKRCWRETGIGEGQIRILVAKPYCRPAAGTALERRRPHAQASALRSPCYTCGADPITGFGNYLNQTMFCALQVGSFRRPALRVATTTSFRCR